MPRYKFDPMGMAFGGELGLYSRKSCRDVSGDGGYRKISDGY